MRRAAAVLAAREESPDDISSPLQAEPLRRSGTGAGVVECGRTAFLLRSCTSEELGGGMPTCYPGTPGLEDQLMVPGLLSMKPRPLCWPASPAPSALDPPSLPPSIIFPSTSPAPHGLLPVPLNCHALSPGADLSPCTGTPGAHSPSHLLSVPHSIYHLMDHNFPLLSVYCCLSPEMKAVSSRRTGTLLLLCSLSSNIMHLLSPMTQRLAYGSVTWASPR